MSVTVPVKAIGFPLITDDGFGVTTVCVGWHPFTTGLPDIVAKLLDIPPHKFLYVIISYFSKSRRTYTVPGIYVNVAWALLPVASIALTVFGPITDCDCIVNVEVNVPDELVVMVEGVVT